MQSFNIQSKPNIKPWDEELSRVPRNEETVLQKAILEERKSLLSDQGTNCNCDDIKVRYCYSYILEQFIAGLDFGKPQNLSLLI